MEEEAERVEEPEGMEETKKTRPSKQHKETHVTPQTEAAGTGHAWVLTTSSASIL